MNSNNYNSLVKLAATKVAREMPPTTPLSVNPATGGGRMMYGDVPIGAVKPSRRITEGTLPITPYSSGKISIDNMGSARRQAHNIISAQRFNEAGKRENERNLDAMFRSLHRTNEQRRAAGLPAYTPNAMDVYAPNASSEADRMNARNSMMNDVYLSTIAQEAARRGTPMNQSELMTLSGLMPDSYQERNIQLSTPAPQYMEVKLPNGLTPDKMGVIANGL